MSLFLHNYDISEQRALGGLRAELICPDGKHQKLAAIPIEVPLTF